MTNDNNYYARRPDSNNLNPSNRVTWPTVPDSPSLLIRCSPPPSDCWFRCCRPRLLRLGQRRRPTPPTRLRLRATDHFSCNRSETLTYNNNNRRLPSAGLKGRYKGPDGPVSVNGWSVFFFHLDYHVKLITFGNKLFPKRIYEGQILINTYHTQLYIINLIFILTSTYVSCTRELIIHIFIHLYIKIQIL